MISSLKMEQGYS